MAQLVLKLKIRDDLEKWKRMKKKLWIKSCDYCTSISIIANHLLNIFNKPMSQFKHRISLMRLCEVKNRKNSKFHCQCKLRQESTDDTFNCSRRRVVRFLEFHQRFENVSECATMTAVFTDPNKAANVVILKKCSFCKPVYEEMLDIPRAVRLTPNILVTQIISGNSLFRIIWHWMHYRMLIFCEQLVTRFLIYIILILLTSSLTCVTKISKMGCGC